MTIDKSKLIQRGPTLFLKLALICIGIAALSLCGFFIYISFVSNDLGDYRPIVMAMPLTSIPLFLGLFQAWKLLQYIDNNIAFSDLSVKALNKIKNYAFSISGFYVVLMPYIFYVAEKDDAPGGILFGFILATAPIVVAVFAAILQKLLKNAIDIKSENDLTV